VIEDINAGINFLPGLTPGGGIIMIKNRYIHKVPIMVLLSYRIWILLYMLLLFLVTKTQLSSFQYVILMSFCILQVLMISMYRQVMRIPLGRLFICIADILTVLPVMYSVGSGIGSYFVCSFIPVFALHIAFGFKGAALGVLGLIAGGSAFVLLTNNVQAAVLTGILLDKSAIASLAVSLVLFYIVPYIALSRYIQTAGQLKSLQDKYDELDSMNSKLLVLYEMTGRFNYENSVSQVMDRLLALCGELFQANRICIFLIRGGEVEIYGKSSPREKEEIYRLIMDQKKEGRDEGREYILKEDTLVIPLIRGTRTDGVLTFYGWKQQEITGRDAILFSMMANMICTYLENLEYVESLQNILMPDTSVMLSHLDSGKPVKGILDRRIVIQEN